MTNEQLCENCGKRFSCQKYLEYHRTVEHSSLYFTCWMCQKRFPTKQTTTCHIMAHIGNVHSCNICGEQQNSDFLLYVHLVTSHIAARPFRCALCGAEYSGRQTLQHHLEFEHPGRISKLAKMAELCCTVHSSRLFPEEDLKLDVLLNQGGGGVQNREEDIRFKQNGSVTIKNGAEIVQKGARLACSQQNKSKSIENTVDLKGADAQFVCSDQEESVPIENNVGSTWGGARFKNSKLYQLLTKKKATVQTAKSLVAGQRSSSSEIKLIPHIRTKLPLRELNEHDTVQNSNKTSEKHPEDILTKLIHNLRKDDKWLFIPHYSITSSQEQGKTLMVYTCETCGMKSEDTVSFILSHQPPDKQS